MKPLKVSFYNPLPDRIQTLLLKACLCEDDLALPAWQEWATHHGFDRLDNKDLTGVLPRIFDHLDFGSQRLLSLLYKKASVYTDHPSVAVLKGYYRYVWVRNQLARDQLHEITPLLNQAGIRNIIIKGFPLVEHYYKDMGARAVLDLDILIHPDQWLQACGVLEESGMKSRYDYLHPEWLPDTLDHGIAFGKNSQEIDLHIKITNLPLDPPTVEALWQEARDYKPGHRMLSPEHQIMASLIHGYQTEGDSALRTVSDITYILKNTPDLRWDYLCKIILTNKLCIPATVFFEYLNNEGFVVIPEEVRDALYPVDQPWIYTRYFDLISRHEKGSGFKAFKLRLWLLGMIPVSNVKRLRLLYRTYKFQWGSDSFPKLVYKSISVFVGKVRSASRTT